MADVSSVHVVEAAALGSSGVLAGGTGAVLAARLTILCSIRDCREPNVG